MYLLIRRISPYTAPDVLLGAFMTSGDAKTAGAHYSAARESMPEADPWRYQSYKMQSPVSDDIAILEFPGELRNGATAYVVSDYSDAMGQVVRRLDSWYPSDNLAAVRIEVLNSSDEDDEFPFPHYALVDVVLVGSIHSDLPEDQPAPHWAKSCAARTISPGVRRFFDDLPQQPRDDDAVCEKPTPTAGRLRAFATRIWSRFAK